ACFVIGTGRANCKEISRARTHQGKGRPEALFATSGLLTIRAEGTGHPARFDDGDWRRPSVRCWDQAYLQAAERQPTRRFIPRSSRLRGLERRVCNYQMLCAVADGGAAGHSEMPRRISGWPYAKLVAQPENRTMR